MHKSFPSLPTTGVSAGVWRKQLLTFIHCPFAHSFSPFLSPRLSHWLTNSVFLSNWIHRVRWEFRGYGSVRLRDPGVMGHGIYELQSGSGVYEWGRSSGFTVMVWKATSLTSCSCEGLWLRKIMGLEVTLIIQGVTGLRRLGKPG